MIKGKYLKLITATALFLAILFTIFILNKSPSIKQEDNNVSKNNTDYVTKIFNKNEVIQLDIVIEEENWEQLLENATKEEYYPADVTINGEEYKTIGIRAKGNSSLSMVAMDDTTDRFSFKLDFGEYIEGQNADGLSKLALNNMIGDPTYMKEYLSYEMMEKMGVNTPCYAYANIILNGKPWGLYLAVEVLEEDFLERYYGEDYGNLYKPESVEMGAKDNRQRPNEKEFPNLENKENNRQQPKMEQAANGQEKPAMEEISNMPDKENMPEPNMGMGRGASQGNNLVYIDDDIDSYQGIFENTVTKNTTKSDQKKIVEILEHLNQGKDLEKYLDVDEIVRYFAVNTFLVNLDSYAGSMKHNYYLYEENGQAQILPWDFNLSFAAFQLNDASKAINFPIDAPVTDTLENSPLISKLLEKEEYKTLYHNYLSQLINTYITSGQFETEVSRIDYLIKNYVKEDETAFFTYEEYEKSIEQLLIFSIDRTKSITAQLAGEESSTNYGNIETTVDLSILGSMNNGQHKEQRLMGERGNPFGENQQPQIENSNLLQTIKSIGIYFMIILISILFVSRFKRKKYIKCE